MSRYSGQQRLLVDSEHVGLGLDYICDQSELAAEIAANPDKFPAHLGYPAGIAMTAPGQLPDLAEELSRRGLDDEALTRIFGGNWSRCGKSGGERRRLDACGRECRMLHAVSLLRAARLARSAKPFLARGGSTRARREGCRLALGHCMCAARPRVSTRAGVCLLMADIEPLKPTNTGWLIADVVADTFAFGWARTEVDPALLALLADPQWQPVVVFPGEYALPERVVHSVAAQGGSPRRPLFILLDATWNEARKMFRKSPYLDRFPVLSLQPEQVSRYTLRRSQRGDHFCTSEVAALCMELAGETLAAQMLEAWLDVFTHHYVRARNQLPAEWDGVQHQRLRALSSSPPTQYAPM